MQDQHPDFSQMGCPIQLQDYQQVLLAHGSGGKLTHQLIEKMFMPAFHNPLLDSRHDGAIFGLGHNPGEGPQVAFTTDSFVVKPLFFPGGDIGTLAVNGTVNDLAMCGARPLYLSAAVILEEGLPMHTLWQVVQSMRAAAQAAGVSIVTGDTKVVDKGKGDGMFINTSGIGIVANGCRIGPSGIRPGDVILVNGDMARHGMTIMAMREGLAFESTMQSDCAPLAGIVHHLLDAGVDIHCLRDLTRGGLATSLVELAETSGHHLQIRENDVPVHEDVYGACQILGLDPLYVANEGKFVCFVPESQADKALALLRAHPLGQEAALIGRVAVASDQLPGGIVTMRSAIGATRVIDMLSGEQLPRIC